VRRPRLLDLFCGAGGAAAGYHRAGFDVVGVDIQPQPRYPFRFVQADALGLLVDPVAIRFGGFDAVHASPPCQAYTVMRFCVDEDRRRAYPDLVAAIRASLHATGLPWVIENVAGAPLVDPVLICGSMFDPPMDIQRHRIFETNWGLEPPMWPCRHKLWAARYPGNRSDRRRDPGRRARVVVVAGNDTRGYAGTAKWREVMGIDWMTRAELSQSIPPAYTHLIGTQLLAKIV